MMIPTNLSRMIQKKNFLNEWKKSQRLQFATLEGLVKTAQLLTDQTPLTKIMHFPNGFSSGKQHQISLN